MARRLQGRACFVTATLACRLAGCQVVIPECVGLRARWDGAHWPEGREDGSSRRAEKAGGCSCDPIVRGDHRLWITSFSSSTLGGCRGRAD